MRAVPIDLRARAVMSGVQNRERHSQQHEFVSPMLNVAEVSVDDAGRGKSGCCATSAARVGLGNKKAWRTIPCLTATSQPEHRPRMEGDERGEKGKHQDSKVGLSFESRGWRSDMIASAIFC